MGRRGVDLSLVHRGRGKVEGKGLVGAGLTSPLYTEVGVRGRERGG